MKKYAKYLSVLSVLLALGCNTANAQNINTMAGNGTSGYSGDGAAATAATLGGETLGVAKDAVGNTYIADYFNNRVRMVNAAGIISTIAGGGTGGDGGPATAASLNEPRFVTVDKAGNIYISERGSNLVRKVNTLGIISTIAGGGAGGDGGAATAASLNAPYGIAVDASGNVLIADQLNNSIRKVDTLGIITTIAGNSAFGYIGDGGPATAAELTEPFGITLDDSGSLYIADWGNKVIRKINTLGIISTVAKGFDQPFDVTVDSAGNMFIADYLASYIYKADKFGTVTIFAGKGSFGFSGDNGPATAALIGGPTGIARDASGNIYMGDAGNYRVREIYTLHKPVTNFTTADSVVCYGNTVQFTDESSNKITNNPSSWNWTFTGGTPASSSAQNPSVVYNTPGTYSVKLVTSNAAGSDSLTKTTYITVRSVQAPALTISSNVKGGLKVCAGTADTLIANATGTGPFSYNWSTGQTNDTDLVYLANTYSVIITDGNGCRNNATATLVVNALPNVGITTGTSTICVGSNTTLTGTGANTYVWTGGPATASYKVSPTSTTTYTVTGTTTVTSCSNTATHVVTVDVVPIVKVVASSDTLCYKNSSILTSSGAVSYTWAPSTGLNTISGTSVTASPGAGSITYTVTGTNLCGSNKDSVTLKVNSLPSVIISGNSGFLCVGADVLTAIPSGALPFNYNWSNGSTANSISVTNPNTYSVTVKDANGCGNTASFNVATDIAPATPSICMVTVDSTSSKNLIEWDKPAQGSIDSFRIYREVASVYKHIASLPYKAFSVFTDTTNGVNPNITSYQYEISAVDTCGNESALSSFHRTIHVSISPASPCGYNLNWNDYIGFNITQYLIYRDSANTGWKVKDSVSFGNVAWSDPTCYAKNDTIGYMVEAVNPSPCTPSVMGHKAITATSTRSNTQHNLVTGVQDLNPAVASVLVYPNPSDGKFSVAITNYELGITNVEVYNILGEIVYSSSSVGHSQLSIDISNMPAGVYSLKITTGKGVQYQKLVKAQ